MSTTESALSTLKNNTDYSTEIIRILTSNDTGTMSSNSSAPEVISFYEDHIFYMYLTATLLKTFALCSLALLYYQIYKHRLAADLSNNFLINIKCWIFSLFTNMWMGYYLPVMIESPYKSGYYILYVGMITTGSTQMVSVSITFLALERVFCIIYPISYEKHRRMFIFATYVGISIGFAINPVTFLLYQPKPPVYTFCKTINCLESKEVILIIYTTRVCIVSMNTIVSFVFSLTLYKFWNRAHVGEGSKAQFRRTNYFVIVASLSEVTFVAGPQLLNVVVTSLFGNVADSIVGSVIPTMGSIDAVVTASLYRYIIMKRMKKDTVQVLPTVNSSSMDPAENTNHLQNLHRD